MACSAKINVLRLAFVHYQHPNMGQAAQFLSDFGLTEADQRDSKIYFRGYGIDPYIYIAEQAPTEKRTFIGGAWAVASYEDLLVAAAHPNGSPIRDNDGPGGGKIVVVTDPNGYKVSFIYGQTLRERQIEAGTARFRDQKIETLANSALDKHRLGHFRRFSEGPSPVHKLGHYGFIVPQDKYRETYDFYLDLIKLKPSDAVYDPVTGEDRTSFIHMDHGKEYTDHHSLFIGHSGVQDTPAFAHHSSFEVNDFDTESLGHNWLLKQGWTNVWGIGRHVLGSQIFDYWFDASGNIVEHYADGDLVNEDTPYTREPEAPGSLYVWGPNIPLAFLTGRVEDALNKHGQTAQKLSAMMPDPSNTKAADFRVTSGA